jgi:hypothetical protein
MGASGAHFFVRTRLVLGSFFTFAVGKEAGNPFF